MTSPTVLYSYTTPTTPEFGLLSIFLLRAHVNTRREPRAMAGLGEGWEEGISRRVPYSVTLL